MRIELAFNEDIFRTQSLLNYRTTTKERNENNAKRLIFGITFSSFGILLAYNEMISGYFVLGLGIHFLINFFNYLSTFIKLKKSYFQVIDSFVKDYKESDQNSIWEFKDEYLFYEDHKISTKMKWSHFNGYRIIEDNLFLDLYPEIGHSYIIGKSETEENWDSIIKLIKEKF